ncbi:MAG: GAF domain-containing protein [Magnetococcales bacterium]|nr:GAF domain-containing protein [Magnetococcales bacterium]
MSQAWMDVLEGAYNRTEDHRAFLADFVEQAPEQLNVERCSIFLHDPQMQRVSLIAGTGLEQDGLDIPVSRSIVGEVVVTGQVRILEQAGERDGVHRDVDDMTGFQTHNILCVPIKASGRGVAGVVQLLNKQGDTGFDARDQQMTEDLAERVQPAVQALFMDQADDEEQESRGFRFSIKGLFSKRR